MKIVIAMIILIAGGISEIALESPSLTSPPESQKLDMILPKSTTEPFIFRTHNVVQKIFSERSPVKIYSGNGEILTAKPKRSAKSQLAEQIPFIRKIKTNPPNHRYFRHYKLRPSYYDPNGRKLSESEDLGELEDENETAGLYDETMTVNNYASTTQQELEDEELNSGKTTNQSDDDVDALVRMPISVTDLSAEEISHTALQAEQAQAALDTTFESTKESEQEHSMAARLHMEHLNIAYSHISNILSQIRSAVDDYESGNNSLMSEKTKKLLQSFVINHDFLEKSLSSSQQAEVPSFYNYFTDEYMTIDDLEEQLLEQDIVDERVERARARKALGFGKIQRIRTRVQSNGRRKLIRLPMKKTEHPRLVRTRFVRRSRRRPIRRAMDNGTATIVTPYEKVINNRDKAVNAIRMVPPQNLNSSHMANFIVIVESLKAFYDSTFAILPDPANIKDKNDQTTRVALDNYRLIEKFYQTYIDNIKTFEFDLDMMKTDLKAIQLGLHNALNFFGYEAEYQNLKCKVDQNCTEIINNFKTAVEVQTKLYSERISNTIIYIDESKADIERMNEHLNRISFPGQNESLFSQEFIDTLNYANDKLPKILGMKEPIYRHLLDLRNEFQVLKDQQGEFDKIFVKAHADVSTAGLASSGSHRNTVISLAIVGLSLLL